MAKRVSASFSTIQFRCFTVEPWPLVVAGNLPELGSWNPDAGLPLQLHSDSGGRREWTGRLRVQAGSRFEFKYVTKTDAGPLWETGENRIGSANGASPEMADEFRK